VNSAARRASPPRYAKARSRVDCDLSAIYAALQAGEKGIPFMPLRACIGTDLLVHRQRTGK